jgi:hypothetical protein
MTDFGEFFDLLASPKPINFMSLRGTDEFFINFERKIKISDVAIARFNEINAVYLELLFNTLYFPFSCRLPIKKLKS